MPRNASKQQDRPVGEERSRLSHVLRSVTRLVSRRPQAALWLLVPLTFISAGLAVALIEFKTERSDLIDRDAAFQQRWINYTESFGDASDLLVVVEADDPETIQRTLDDLGGRMQREPQWFANVLYKVDLTGLSRKGLQYLSPQQLEAGLKDVSAFDSILDGRWNALTLEALFSRLTLALTHGGYPGSVSAMRESGSQDNQAVLDQADSLTTSLAAYLADPQHFRSPWPELAPQEGAIVDASLREASPHAVSENDNVSLAAASPVTYLLNDAGTMGFLKAVPAGKSDGFGGYSESIRRLRKLMAEVSAEHPHARLSLTGIPVLENDEMSRSQSDMMTASVLSFVGVGLLLILGFRGVRHPLLALVMLVVGLAWAFGYTALTVGHLNILSVSFAVILIGLGIDFGIHYLARYLELRHEGRFLRPALLETSSSVGTGIVTAAVTTAVAFFCAAFTRFVGVAELGMIAGGGILLCALATFVVLPALVALADQNVEPRKLPTPFEGRSLRWLTSRCPWIVLGMSCAVFVVVASQVVIVEDGHARLRVGYDSNLLNLQADGLESVEIQKRLFQNAHDSLLFAVSIADSPAEARALRKRFEALPSVDHVEELASRLPADSFTATQPLVQAFRSRLSRLPDQPPPRAHKDPATVGRVIENFYLAVRRIRHPLAEHAARTLDAFLDQLERLSAREQAAFLSAYQYRLQSSLLFRLQALRAASTPEPVTLDDLPAELTSRFVSRDGKWLLQIYPRERIWDVEPLERFVKDLRTVDADVTGTPLQNYEASRQIRSSYQMAAVYALVMVFVVLLIDFLNRQHKLLVLLPPLAVVLFGVLTLKVRGESFSPVWLVSAYGGMVCVMAAILDPRNFRDAALAMIPPLGGGLLMFGSLGLLGIDLNPANLIALPLIVGIGVDDGVHVIHDFHQQRGPYRTSSSTMNAIVLTSLTSMVGFGSLMVAAHRGLYSVGLVLVLGVGSCLFMSLVPLPAMLTLISRRRNQQRAVLPASGPSRGVRESAQANAA